MRRALATVAAAAALLPAGIAGAQCTPSVAWHTTRYKPVTTRERVPMGPRLGRGVILGCTIMRGRQGGLRRVVVYRVRGLRPRVAIALRPSKPALYVSSATPTAAERRVLDRLRARWMIDS